MRAYLTAAVSVFVAGTALAGEKTFETTPKDFGSLELATTDVKLNNFNISESSNFMTPKGWKNVEVQLSAKNLTGDSVTLQLQVVGLDAAGVVLWATKAEPMMGMLGEDKLEEVKGDALVKSGALKKTAKIIVHVRGSFR
jgi:hypothetical protein